MALVKSHQQAEFNRKADELLREMEAKERALREAEAIAAKAREAQIEREKISAAYRDLPVGDGSWSEEEEARFARETWERQEAQIAAWAKSANRERDRRIAGMACGIVSIL